ncbi:hypothetical protein Q7P36_009599 [Cladosporium allicinum]
MSSNDSNNNACASSSCKHTCSICGHQRCHCPRCTYLSSEIRIVSSTRRHRDLPRKWRKILARPKCCKCLQKPKPIHFIDLVEKENLTFIEYAGCKKEDPTTESRRSPPLSAEEQDRLKTKILTILNPPKLPMSPPPPPSPTTPTDRRIPRDPDQDGPGSSSALLITAFSASIPPPPPNLPTRTQISSSASQYLEHALRRAHAAARRLGTLQARHQTPLRALTRRYIRDLFTRLANLTLRLHPQLSSLVCPGNRWVQGRLDSARDRVQSAYKELFRVAFRAGLLERFDRRRKGTGTGTGTALGMTGSVLREDGAVRDLVRRTWDLIGELGLWIATVRASGVWFARAG